jgi:hypothetical protein
LASSTVTADSAGAVESVHEQPISLFMDMLPAATPAPHWFGNL